MTGAVGAILAHELGHTKAFFSVVRPKFEERISKYRAKGRLSDEEKEMVRMIFKTVMKESEKQSGDQASNDELEWYRRNGFYERKEGGVYEFEKK